jgi:hypothetical protein
VLPGGYPMIASGASDPDYSISYVPGTLLVTPAPLVITANNPTKVYGAAMPGLSASYSGFVNGDTPANLSTPPVLSTTATTTSQVLPRGYPIIASGASDPDYSMSYVPGTLLITPAPLVIAANNASMVQGAAIPALTVIYSGLVNGDTASCLSTLPTVATEATPASRAGTYPIVVSGACSTNYVITSENGLLTVTAAPVRVVGVSLQTVHLGKHHLCKKTTQIIVLKFNGPLNPASAQATSCYRLATIASGKQKSCAVALSSAAYSPTDDTVRLTTKKPLVFGPSVLLRVGGLSDWLGRPLDGNCVAILSNRGVCVI